MLINNKEENGHVKFISYTGRYPNLCRGVLTLEIDGTLMKFGIGEMHHSFWTSGGSVSFDNEWENAYVEQEEWVIDYQELPKHIREYASEIDKVFNENVPYGCCGGCI